MNSEEEYFILKVYYEDQLQLYDFKIVFMDYIILFLLLSSYF